jgi:AraC-like DNA-binding protein
MEVPSDLDILCRYSANDSLQIIIDSIKKPLKLKHYQELVNSCHHVDTEWGNCKELFNEEGIKIIERHYLKYNNFYYFIWMTQQYHLYDKHILRQINEYMGNLFTGMNITWPFYCMNDLRLCKKLFSWKVEDVMENLLYMSKKKELFEYAMKSMPDNHYWDKPSMINVDIYYIKTYIKYGGNINEVYDWSNHKTLLEFAIAFRKFEHCKILLENGAIVTDRCRELIKNTDIPQEILELL